MSTQNEDSNTQQPLSGVSANHLPFDWEEPPSGDAAARAANEAARFEEVKQRVIDAMPKDLTQAEKFARTVARKERKQEQAKEQAPATEAKPVRAKRTKAQPVGDAKDQAENVSTPKRTSIKKAAKAADVPSQVVSAAGDIPPITPAAIKFLGKQDATAADVLELGSDSLAFVQYHFKHMQQLEAKSQLTNAYLVANARPISPAFQKFADALVGHRRRQTALVTRQAAAEVPEPDKQQATRVPAASYGQKAAAVPAYAPAIVRFRTLEIISSRTKVQAQATEPVPDDTKRAHRVVGTAHILMSVPINDLIQKEAADLVAGDIQEVRAIKDATPQRIALNAMVESGLAQPRYKTEFEKQAPDLVDPAIQAHKAMKADWDLAYKVSSTLSHIAEASEPLAKEEAVTLAKNTIEAIRAIKGDQHRQEALSFSHQIGHWQPLYKEEFARQAPDLVVSAQAAYKAEEAKEERDGREVEEIENSIERSPVQLVMAAQQTSSAKQATAAKQTSPVDHEFGAERKAAEQQSTRFAPSAEKAASDPVPRPSLGKRLLLAIGDAAQKAGIWLSEQGREDQAPPPNASVSHEKPTASTAPASLAVSADDRSTVVPEAIARRFLKVEHEYYFPDRTPAFSDRGNKLATRGTHPEVVRSLVEIAKARGWDTITVKGTEEFRRSAWIEAAQYGLTVTGYKPTALDLAELATRPGSNTVEKDAAKEKNLLPAQPAAQAGTILSAATRSAASRSPEPEEQQLIPELAEKARAFQENKPAFVMKKYPDLAAAYGIVAAAKAFATDRLPEGAREEFVEMTRRHVVQKITAGEQIKGPKIYVVPTKTAEVDNQTKPVQEAVDLGKSARAKEVERER